MYAQCRTPSQSCTSIKSSTATPHRFENSICTCVIVVPIQRWSFVASLYHSGGPQRAALEGHATHCHRRYPPQRSMPHHQVPRRQGCQGHPRQPPRPPEEAGGGRAPHEPRGSQALRAARQGGRVDGPTCRHFARRSVIFMKNK